MPISSGGTRANNFRYTGEQYDSGTALYYLRFRRSGIAGVVNSGFICISQDFSKVPGKSWQEIMLEKRGVSPKLKSKSPSRNRKSRTIPPDKVWQLYDGVKVKLGVRILQEKSPAGLPSILLEGNKVSLEWLADFILASAADERDCGSSASPDGPGNIFFDKTSEFGIYIHRLPCSEHKK